MRPRLILASAVLACLVLGSVHGFSVFLEPAQAKFAGGRSMVSLSYSLALVAITIMVLLGARVYGRVFIAWGAVGLVGPLVAGAVFDATGTYKFSLMLAAALGAVSASMITRKHPGG